jgi:hypothetical protein
MESVGHQTGAADAGVADEVWARRIGGKLPKSAGGTGIVVRIGITASVQNRGNRMFSFSAHKRGVDLKRQIRRLIDLTSPNRANSKNVQRCEDRYNRAIPAPLCPWQQSAPIVSMAVVAITKDIADRGVGLILSGVFNANEVVVGFCDHEVTGSNPWFFLGTMRTSVAVGGGFWSIGIELTDFMNDNWANQLEPLFPLARKLVSPSSRSEHNTALLDQAVSLVAQTARSS